MSTEIFADSRHALTEMTTITEGVINIPFTPTAVDDRRHEIIQNINTEGYVGLPTETDVDKSLQHVNSTQ